MRNNTKFLEGLKKWDISLSEHQLVQFEAYYDLLIKWNEVMNLTAITDYEEVITKHFLDSLALVKTDKELKGKILLDLGTGAGFPGIPLKIAFPELNILLVDSLNKRINFLNEVISQLGLEKIQAIHGRAEELGRKQEYRESFDFCVSRAVARLVSLAEYCMPFVKKGGYFIPYKSEKTPEELKEAAHAISILGGRVEDTITFELPDSDMERTLIVIRKGKETPKAYPRAGGKPTKAPLVK